MLKVEKCIKSVYYYSSIASFTLYREMLEKNLGKIKWMQLKS